ncbi:MAG TPA: DUF1993 domain-containing protein [Steroidobacteraceae bacterium]|nr:DUF1993 domain-containing protein [Steroidobacteraceae bacterium]
MSVSLYEVSVPPLIHALSNLSSLIDKAAAHAEAKKIDPAVFVQARLYPDMLPFSRQVQIACDNAKGGAARLADVEVPKHEDSEKTLPELQARIAKTVEFLKSIDAQRMRDAERREIELKLTARTLRFTGLAYLNLYVLPNVYFHVSIAYALLREGGVEVGKRDFLGPIQ